ncbi:MAG: hypothetical protein AB8B79_04570 [Granulosicoccus sp.]
MLESYLMVSGIDFSGTGSGDVAHHLSAAVLCLLIAYIVRRQIGREWVMLGAGLLMFRELFSLLAHISNIDVALESILPGLVLPLMYGTLILGYGFVGIGVMQPHQANHSTKLNLCRWLKVFLLLSIAMELGLFVHRLSMTTDNANFETMQVVFQFLSLTLIIAVVCYRRSWHSKLTLVAADGQRQLDAMLSMFSAVKHDLNNDMQVVVGNAELAELLITTGGDIQKPVTNITDAASVAIQRIEQLSVFNSSLEPSLSPIDLNSVLRECMAKIVSEIPALVTLRLELQRLPIRVMADRSLLSLSLVHLIRQAVNTMPHGGEIVIRTQDLCKPISRCGSAAVSAEVFIVRALAVSTNANWVDQPNRAVDAVALQSGFSTAKSLVERSGAVSVAHSQASKESVFSMGFVSESIKEQPRPVFA